MSEGLQIAIGIIFFALLIWLAGFGIDNNSYDAPEEGYCSQYECW